VSGVGRTAGGKPGQLVNRWAMPIFRRLKERTLSVTPNIDREMDEARPRRYLVLGSEGHGRGVRSHRWDHLPDDLNVADYDVVVLNFAAFKEAQLAEGFPKDRLPSVEAMTRLVFSPNAEIVAIGDPSTLIGARPDQTSTPFYDPRVRCDYWLPFYIGVEDDIGTQYHVDAAEWAAYFEHLSNWRWIATGETPTRHYQPGDYLRPVTSDAHDLEVALEPIARTRYEKLIALRVHLRAIRYGRYLANYGGIADPDPSTRQLVLEASPVVWLPTPDRVRPEEAIDTILRERYGIAQEVRLPEWAASYPLPDEAPIASEIVGLEQERRELEQRISETRSRAVEAARPRLLLYEKGKDVLEPVVRETLRALGARVEDPEVDGIEDGKLFRDEVRGILEIKGRNGPIKQDDVRQVVQWASDAKLRDGVEYKPLIVGNPHCDKPLEERGEVLAPNAARYASNGGVAVVTTSQVFEALRQKQAGAFDEAHFWKTVFDTNGVAELDEPRAR
jgi:hypothetical protein